MQNSVESKLKKGGLIFLAGMTLGYLGSFFMPAKSRKKQKKFIDQQTQKLKDIMTDQDPAQRIKDIFKENTAQMKEKYENLKHELAQGLASLGGTVEDINKQKYSQVLNNVLKQAKQDKTLSQEQADKLKNYLEQDFEKIKKNI